MWLSSGLPASTPRPPAVERKQVSDGMGSVAASSRRCVLSQRRRRCGEGLQLLLPGIRPLLSMFTVYGDLPILRRAFFA